MPRCANDIALFALQHQTLDRLARRETTGSIGSIMKALSKPPRDGGVYPSIYRRRPASQSGCRSLEELAE
jgi:hypothetical protein